MKIMSATLSRPRQAANSAESAVSIAFERYANAGGAREIFSVSRAEKTGPLAPGVRSQSDVVVRLSAGRASTTDARAYYVIRAWTNKNAIRSDTARFARQSTNK